MFGGGAFFLDTVYSLVLIGFCCRLYLTFVGNVILRAAVRLILLSVYM